VHISIVCFDAGFEERIRLDGQSVGTINSDLSVGADLTRATRIGSQEGISFQGTINSGEFDVSWDRAASMLRNPSAAHGTNSEVLKPWLNGKDITSRGRGQWIVDFGFGMPESEAAKYEAPFEYTCKIVKPGRDKTKYAPSKKYPYWQLWCARPEMRAALSGCERYVGTPRVTKHRLFVWLSQPTLPDAQVIVFARSDDYFFGVLHSSIHELWARRMGTQLREAESGFRYTPTTCFETFPLPWAPGKEPIPILHVDATPSPGVHAGRNEQPPAINCGTRDQPPAMNDGARDQPPAMNDGAREQPRAMDDGARDGTDPGAVEVYERISKAAQQLNELRERWLNPPEWVEPIARGVDAEDDFADMPEEARALIRHSAIMARAAKDPKLKERTLTNLYNERPTWLKLAHEQLDRAVLAAYAATDPDGKWSEDWAQVWVESGAGQPLPDGHELTELRKDIDQRVLANLLRMNLARAGNR
jgi:hypothetical protein